MAREYLPINPRILQWARERSGFSYGELSKAFVKFEDWEKGDAMPTYSQLEGLSEKLKIPIAVFFFPDPPSEEPLRNSFRTLPDTEFNQIPPSMLSVLRKAKSMQINLEEIGEVEQISQRKMLADLSFDPQTSIEEIANSVRDYLAVSVEDQKKWKNLDSALKAWRHIFSVNGIFVFKDAFKANEYSGFCLYDESVPIIVINNTTSKTRQIFTLFHELAHLIFRTSGVDKFEDNYLEYLDSNSKRIEVLCNKFASVFLVPDQDFTSLIEGVRLDENYVVEIANYFKVSREVILRKLLDMGLVGQRYYEESTRKWHLEFIKSRKGGESDAGNFYNTRIAYLGRDYIDLALKQYHQNRIDESQLSNYLNIKPKHLEKFQENYSG